MRKPLLRERLFYFCTMWKAGDQVSFLNESGGGEILSVEGDQALVLCDTGFEDRYPLRELVHKARLEIDRVELKAEDQGARHHSAPKQSFKPGRLEVDLHFGQLVRFPKNYSAHKKMQIQLDAARSAVEKARRGGIKTLILIHGVGEGRLREEVHCLLERMDRLTFYDASYAEYGTGATEVELL